MDYLEKVEKVEKATVKVETGEVRSDPEEEEEEVLAKNKCLTFTNYLLLGSHQKMSLGDNDNKKPRLTAGLSFCHLYWFLLDLS
jgi:hypothetical protein